MKESNSGTKPARNRDRDLVVVAHNIRSLHNVGSIFRTADSFGVSKIVLSGYTGTPPDPKISKVALGAEEFVPWEKNKSLVRIIKKMRADGFRILALENNIPGKTTVLQNYRPKWPLALILGEETTGLPKKILDLVDDVVEIKMLGKKESLNVSVACGVALFQLTK